ESTTIEPDAINAPDSAVVPAQPPTPATRSTNTVMPASTLRRIERRVDVVWGFKLGTSRARDDLERLRRRSITMQPLPQAVVFRPEGHRASLLHCGDKAPAGNRRGAMRDPHDDAAAGADAENRLGQGRIAVRIQIGVRFVQHDQKRIVIEGAGERYP